MATIHPFVLDPYSPPVVSIDAASRCASKRNCRLFVNCCNSETCCLSCHAKEKGHNPTVENVTQIICCADACGETQPYERVMHAQQTEEHTKCNCGRKFADYVCLECLVFESGDIFHCEECKSCRLGIREKFRHCPNCGYCIEINVKLRPHVCYKESTTCPVCLQEFSVNDPLPMLQFQCGHFIHKDCWAPQIQRCPLCRETVVGPVEFKREEESAEPQPMQQVSGACWPNLWHFVVETVDDFFSSFG